MRPQISRSQATISGSGKGIRRRGGKRAQLQLKNGYRGLLLAPRRSADFRPRSPQPLRTRAVAASATNCVYAGVVTAPQATVEPFSLSIFVPATRARRFVRRVQVTLARSKAGHKRPRFFQDAGAVGTMPLGTSCNADEPVEAEAAIADGAVAMRPIAITGAVTSLA